MYRWNLSLNNFFDILEFRVQNLLKKVAKTTVFVVSFGNKQVTLKV